MATAVQLKEQGNALFVKKDFAHAHDKYTEAIAIDERNAVLYANRSACSFGMSKWLDAVRDAAKATEIDPTYAKGWSRLASAQEALQQWEIAVTAWKKALEALPKGDLSPAELKQKEQYVSSLDKAKQRLEAAATEQIPHILVHDHEKLPWQIAEEMLPELRAAGPARYNSSGWLLNYANKDFVQGVEYMKKLKHLDFDHASGKVGILGHTGSITCISNAIMTDSRVFRIDSNDWMDKFNRQLSFEIEKYQAWASENVAGIQKAALARLKREGWDAVRPALAVSVRGWFMRAFFECQIRKLPHIGVEWLKQTLELLHWGRQVWRDVPKDDRGVIFEDTFARGVKVHYLEALMEAHSHAQTDADKKAFLETLFEEATALAKETLDALNKKSPTDEPIDPGFASAYYVYPAAEAEAMLGYYHVQMARASGSAEDKKKHYLFAVNHYGQAACRIPLDDEKHCWYANCSVDPSLKAGVPKDMVLQIVKGIREAMPVMRRIWGNSVLAKQGRDTMIEMTLQVAEKRLK